MCESKVELLTAFIDAVQECEHYNIGGVDTRDLKHIYTNNDYLDVGDNSNVEYKFKCGKYEYSMYSNGECVKLRSHRRFGKLGHDGDEWILIHGRANMPHGGTYRLVEAFAPDEVLRPLYELIGVGE